LESSC